MDGCSVTRANAARLGAYGVVLGLAFGGGALIGATLGPEPSRGPSGQGGGHSATTIAADPHETHQP